MIRIIFIELQVLLKKLVYCTNLKECFLLKNIRRKKNVLLYSLKVVGM